MVPVARPTSTFAAQLLAARLGAEGIVWQLRGFDSVYPVQAVEVLVAADDLERARDVIRLAEADGDLVGAATGSVVGDDPAGDRRAGMVFGAVLVALVVGFLLARILALS